ncbi:tetraspanin-15-like isoform X2 [Anneissia japonica]|uniref:tetraspanin-15-like isoform X2 n=1 Tax=Anneissia japonica TaxID=1529436 RepID=UPI001425B71B|nr:tetraspanin-15-like isoform X2 [Anneissia japonica]XP_033113892.1 tetraspanin-15-like isoform X2 [Anneissia japonica]
MPSLKGLPKPTCGHRILRIILFIYDVGFWLIGGVILGIGIYAEVEKKDYIAVVDVMVTPTIFMIFVGSFMFVLGFIGCLGTLRENITLLRIFGITLAVVFTLQLIGAILALAFKGQTENLVKNGLQHSIRNYYNDPDIQFAVDAMQQNFECCGGHDYDDWENNIYFMCNTGVASSCGVPYTCCVSTKDEMIPNTQCGDEVRKGITNRLQLQGKIYIRGCVDAFSAWAEDNLALIAGIILGFALPQIAGIWMTFGFIQQIKEENENAYVAADDADSTDK